MKTIIKKIIAGSAYYSRLITIIRKLFPNKELSVLMFHKVKKKNFESQIKYLKKHYNVINEEEAINYFYNKKKIPKNSVLITFDDGYLNNYENAYPALKKQGLKAIIFIATKFIGTKKMPWYDQVTYLINNTQKKEITFQGKKYSLTAENKKKLIKKYYYYIINNDEKKAKETIKELERQCQITKTKIDFIRKTSQPTLISIDSFMNWQQVNEIKNVFSIGCHTHSHPILPNISLKRKQEEIKKSKELIKKKTGTTPKSFCYPNGDFDEETINVIKNNGFKLAFTTIFGKNNQEINPYKIRRIPININDDKNVLAAKLISGTTKIFKNKKKKFKVIMLTNYYYPQLGGLTTSIDKLSRGLRENNILVKIFPFPNKFRKIEKIFKNKKIIHRLLVGVYILMVITLYIITRIRYRKVIIHSHSSNFCAYAAYLGKYFGFKTIHNFRTDFTPEEMKQTKAIPFLNEMDSLIACSKKLAENSKKKFDLKKEIKVIHESIIINDNKALNKQEKRKQNNTIKILFVGNLLKIKDPLLFVKGIEELNKIKNKTPILKNKKIIANIIGDGPLREEIKKYITKNKLEFIKLRGYIAKEKMDEIYQEHDVLVLTSKGEGFGNVLLEAMNNNTPVVATPVGGVKELIKNNFNGIIIKKRTGTEVAKAIIKALNNKKKLVVNARKTMEKNFSHEKIIKKYIRIYQDLLFNK